MVRLAVLLQLLIAAAPSSGLVLCVSSDGCTALEIVVPGTRQCVERDCDEAHAGGDDEHACRDFEIVTAAPAKAAAGERPVILPAMTSSPVAIALAVAHRRAGAERPACGRSAAWALRSTILQL